MHAFIGIGNADALLSHPVLGTSFEGRVIEDLAAACGSDVSCRFYRTSGGAEIDLLLSFPSGALWAIEVKRSLALKVDRAFILPAWTWCPERGWVYPGNERWTVGNGVEMLGLAELCAVGAEAVRGG